MARKPEDTGPAKTVFEPPANSPRNAEDAWMSGGEAEATPKPAAKGRKSRKAPPFESTILQPSAAPVQPSSGSWGAAPAASPSAGAPPAVGTPGSGRVAIGSVLNHIYEVKRFIARGGMGEVYEGVNVNTDERVAIKVVLPHLAADPNVQAMFRKEARTLTRLSHPALVQYRVLANEPVLGVLYIVTDYLDGVGLDQLIGRFRPSPPQLVALIRRLAEGLKVAHDLGAIHRDISPDNILLPGERIESATIIDFGIAKDLDASHATIVGVGFAGKLAFVAPEQFGDFGREIGPWTDIYSLGLVMLAVVAGRNVDMGTTLVEAIDRRRAGPDLSVLPPGLKPLFGRMLAANPKDRFRSMDEVLAALAALDIGKLETAVPDVKAVKPPKPQKPAPPPPPPKARTEPPTKPPSEAFELRLPGGGGPDTPIYLRPPVIAAAAGALVLAIGVPIVLGMMPKGDGKPDPARDPLAKVACSWLERSGGDDSRTIVGAAGPGFEGATRAVKGSDTSGVLPLQGQACGLLEAVRPLRAPVTPGAEWIKSASDSFVPGRQAECGGDPRQALTYTDVDTNTASGEDMAVYLLRPGGTVQPMFRSKAQIRAGSGMIASVTPVSAGRVRIGVCNDLPGTYGLLAVRGAGPFTAEAGGPIADRLAAEARSGGWTSQMDWYRVESAPAAPVAAPTPSPAPVVKVAPPPARRAVVQPRVRQPEKARTASPPPQEAPPPPKKAAPPRSACTPGLDCL